MSLDGLREKDSDIPIYYLQSPQTVSLRPTQNSKGTIYFGGHRDRQTLSIISWDEQDGTGLGKFDEHFVRVDLWSDNDRISNTPAGVNWLGFMDRRITGAWDDGENIGFAWCAAQDQRFPNPQVRVAIAKKADLKSRPSQGSPIPISNTIAQPHIYSSERAFAYPACTVSKTGLVGLSIAYGGDEIHPSHAVGVLKPDLTGWVLKERRQGTNSVSSQQADDRNIWGDYLSIRPYKNGFVSCGFTVESPNSDGVELCYSEFTADIAAPTPTPGAQVKVKRQDLLDLKFKLISLRDELDRLIEDAEEIPDSDTLSSEFEVPEIEIPDGTHQKDKDK